MVRGCMWYCNWCSTSPLCTRLGRRRGGDSSFLNKNDVMRGAKLDGRHRIQIFPSRRVSRRVSGRVPVRDVSETDIRVRHRASDSILVVEAVLPPLTRVQISRNEVCTSKTNRIPKRKNQNKFIAWISCVCTFHSNVGSRSSSMAVSNVLTNVVRVPKIWRSKLTSLTILYVSFTISGASTSTTTNPVLNKFAHG